VSLRRSTSSTIRSFIRRRRKKWGVISRRSHHL